MAVETNGLFSISAPDSSIAKTYKVAHYIDEFNTL